MSGSRRVNLGGSVLGGIDEEQRDGEGEVPD